MRIRRELLNDPVALKCHLWHLAATLLASRLVGFARRAEQVEKEIRALQRHTGLRVIQL